MFMEMPIHDQVDEGSVHLDIHDCQPCINMGKCSCKCCRVWSIPKAGGIALAVNDSMHALHPGLVGNSTSAMLENSPCAQCQLDMPATTGTSFYSLCLML